MLFRTHLAFSVLLSLILLKFVSFTSYGLVLFLVFVIFSTALVDIDSRNSKLGKYWFFRPLQWVFPHRTLFHSVFFVFFLGFFVFLFSQVAAVGFFVGYLSHLFLDIFTTSGLKLFWPIYNRNISLLNLKTGGILEEFLFILLLLGDIFLVGKNFFDIFF